jgi:murein L,D-transpeptidase YcbB/YkuD
VRQNLSHIRPNDTCENKAGLEFVKFEVCNRLVSLLKILTILFFVAIFLLASLSGSGQVITKEHLARYKAWPRYTELQQFYEQSNGQPVWLGNKGLHDQLLEALSYSSSQGLNRKDYQEDFLATYKPGQELNTFSDSLETEIRLTDAAIHFFTELKWGNAMPSFGYRGFSYPSRRSIIPELWTKLQHRALRNFVDECSLSTKEFLEIKGRMNWFQDIISQPGFSEVRIVSTKMDMSNKPLLTRLYQLGVLDSLPERIAVSDLIRQVKIAQRLFDVLDDGILRSTSLQAFNRPLIHRIAELKLGLNYLRWLEPAKQGSVLLLNIPAAWLMVYDQGQVILDSKVIVGKRATPTPTLTSTISEVILYPYWMVPYKIATRELLPSIKRNIGFLEAGNYQVINKQGKIMNPYSINWNALSTTNFPYIIRQSTGCDNALGIVKFNFYNPFTVYLHDTPAKSLFNLNKRYFSHGCMRVEKPIELAHLLLGHNRMAIDTLTAKGCVYQQSPIVVPVERALPVMIFYSTVWYNRQGEIKFYEDIYDRNRLN